MFKTFVPVSLCVLLPIGEGFLEFIVIAAVGKAVSLVMVIFITVGFVMVVFVITHCRNMHNIAPHGSTDVEALISSSAVVQEGSRED